MTVSYFVALEAEIPAVEARQQMALAEAALYPQLKPEHARRLWMYWERQANPPRVLPGSPTGGVQFFWNGRAIRPSELRQRLAGALGAGLTA